MMEVVRVDLAYMAEHTISRLASSYATCGGMNTTMGGASTESANKAKGTTWEMLVSKSGDRILQSVREEYERVVGSRNDLRMVIGAREQQVHLRKLLKGEDELRKTCDTEQTKMNKAYEELNKEVEPWIAAREEEAKVYTQVKALDESVDDMEALLKKSFGM